jgi:hypothetical protein
MDLGQGSSQSSAVASGIDAEATHAAPGPQGSPVLALLAELEGADDLALEDRLVLLRRVESTISASLEGLDGL